MIGKLVALAGVAIGLGIAARAGAFDGPKARQARKELGAAFRRVPLPHIIVHMPRSYAELESLDAALCECALHVGAAAGMTHDQLLALAPEVQNCAAQVLFPDIDWPPVHSDNPSIHQYWAILDHRFRSLVYSGEIAQFCGLAAVAPPPSVNDIQPRSVQAGTAPLVTVHGVFAADTAVDFERGDGRHLPVHIQSRTESLLELVVDADEPGSYDLIVSNGPNPASSIAYEGAFAVV